MILELDNLIPDSPLTIFLFFWVVGWISVLGILWIISIILVWITSCINL